MELRRFRVAFLASALLLTGCQTGKFSGLDVTDTLFSIFTKQQKADEDEIDERASREAWLQATDGSWDGVEHEVKY